MNLAATVALSFGGIGSGCRGPSCGRPKVLEEGSKEQQAFSVYRGSEFRGINTALRRRAELKDDEYGRHRYDQKPIVEAMDKIISDSSLSRDMTL
jgi:hypothetical protein